MAEGGAPNSVGVDARIRARPSLIVELIAGSVAGAAQVIVGQPLDTVKTRAQIAPRMSYALRLVWVDRDRFSSLE